MRFKQDGILSNLNVYPLKLVCKFKYFGCHISSADVNVYEGMNSYMEI